jgi:hypothetical protein
MKKGKAHWLRLDTAVDERAEQLKLAEGEGKQEAQGLKKAPETFRERKENSSPVTQSTPRILGVM